ncbi:putative ribonuclease H-like domain-containing protein [Tanacetum coccineum]
MRLTSENQANRTYRFNKKLYHAGTKDIINAADSEKRMNMLKTTFVLPIWPSYSSTITPALKTDEKREGPREEEQVFLDELERLKRQENEANEEAEALRKEFAQETENLGLSLSDPTNPDQDDSEIPPLEDIYQNSTDGIFTNSSYDDEGAVADFTNLETVMNVSPIPTSRIHSSHPSTLILGDPTSAVQTRSKVNKSSGAHAFVSLSLDDDKLGWMLCKKIAAVFRFRSMGLSDLPYGQEEGIDYDEVFAPVARIEAIRIFLAFSSYNEVSRSNHPQMSTKLSNLYMGYIKLPEAWLCYFITFLLKNGYRRGTIDKTLFIKKDKHDIILMSSIGELTFFLGLQVKQKADGIFISQDKYVAEILKKFDFANVKTASTPIETQKPLVKDEEASDVDVHLYRSMIGSLMYLTASRPDIMFAVCACSRFQVTPKSSHLSAGSENFVRTIISWQCKKQYPLWQLLIEAEYVAAASAVGKFCGFKSYKQLANVPVPLDHFPVNTLTSKVFSFMVKKGKHFSGNVTPLFASCWFNQLMDAVLLQISIWIAQPTPSMLHSDITNEPQTKSSYLTHTSEVADQAIEIQHLRLRLQKKSRRQLNLYSNTTAAWAASVSLKHDWQEEILKEKLGAQRVYTLDHMETENAQVGGRIRDIMGEEKEIDENILSTEISLLTLKAHSKNDQKTKGKKKIEEEDESNKSETVVFLKLRRSLSACKIEADRLLAEKLPRTRMRAFYNRRRAKVPHDTIAAQEKIPCSTRSRAIRNKPTNQNH